MQDREGVEIIVNDVVQFVACPNKELIGAIGTVTILAGGPAGITCVVSFYHPRPRLVAAVVAVPSAELVRIGHAFLKHPDTADSANG